MHEVKKLPYLLRYVPDQCKAQPTCGEAILGNDGTLKCIPDCYKNQGMCNKAVNNYFVLFDSIPDQYKTQERTVSDYLFLMVYCPKKYIA